MARRLRLCDWQLGTCVLGAAAGFVPGVSWTGRFSGMDYMSGGFVVPADDARVRVTRVVPGSPADRAEFRTGDVIQNPANIDGFRGAEEALRRGERRQFVIRRGEEEVVIQAGPAPPELAAVWYADLWYPVAGAVFSCIGLLVFATGPLAPAPWWRTVPVAVAGVGLAVGFAAAMARGSVFSRFRIYQRWPMGGGDEWYFQQGALGLAAGALLAVFAAAEIRARLAGPAGPAAPRD
jgi:hypothetical protein